MATKVQVLYDEVAKILMETDSANGGLASGTGIITDGMFFAALGEALLEFASRTGVARDMYNIQAVAGTGVYSEPCGLADVLYVSFGDVYLFHTSGYTADRRSAWFLKPGMPLAWREDELPIRRLQIIPTPMLTGHYIDLDSVGFGTISAATAGQDFDVTSTNDGYGVISDASTGGVYLDSVNQGFGTITNMVPSVNNLQAVANTIPIDLPTSIHDIIPIVPDTFLCYLRYMVLDRLFSADSEQKDTSRAVYCRMRVEEGIGAITALMDEDGIEPAF